MFRVRHGFIRVHGERLLSSVTPFYPEIRELFPHSLLLSDGR